MIKRNIVKDETAIINSCVILYGFFQKYNLLMIWNDIYITLYFETYALISIALILIIYPSHITGHNFLGHKQP